MIIYHKNQIEEFKDIDACAIASHPQTDKDINCFMATISGRYPDSGSVVNMERKELAYIQKGSGVLVVEGEEVKLNEGDLVLIEKGEKYHWDGNMTIFISCAPAWHPEQHKCVE